MAPYGTDDLKVRKSGLQNFLNAMGW